ncbi:10603_t:CDS:2, partial [Racocetra persica]
NRSDICKKFSITVGSVIEGITWERKETKVWRNNILMKFLHHLNLAPSKYRLGALYDVLDSKFVHSLGMAVPMT